jgi:glycerophosphoryl diester phosphodiesterase
VKCIGHAGASALAPGNSLRSFGLAAEHGADHIEFDVRLVGGRLLLAHTGFQARLPGCLSLAEALDALAGPKYDGIGLVADLKTPGTERPVVDALRRFGLFERAMLTSQCRPILAAVREYDPEARTGMSVAGHVSRRLNKWGAWRDEIVAGLRAGDFQALMSHRGHVDADLVDRVRGAGGELYAWTVGCRREIASLAGLGIDGVVTPDPRLMLGVARA